MYLQRPRNLILALLLAATSAVVASSPAVALTPRAVPARAQAGTANELRPQIMTQAADVAAMPASPTSLPSAAGAPHSLTLPSMLLNSSLRREVFGFVNAGNLASPTVGYSTWNFGLLTTVAYFGLQVNSGDGALVQGTTGWNVYHSATMGSFARAANAAGTRVIVSLNLHDFSASPTNQVCQGLISTNAQVTISQAVQQMQAAGIQGINIDYEGTNTTCANGLTSRAQLVSYTKNLRAAMQAAVPGSYLAIDTYSGSAEDNQEFFDISGLAPYVDSFFVMAYDMDFSNYLYAPLGCPSFCFNPVAALNSYRFNDTLSMAQYTALVPANKVILGVPYYGRKGCVANLITAHQGPDSFDTASGRFVSPTYLYSVSVPTDTGVSNFTAHRDPSEGSSEWDTWYSTDFNCNREQYWDDVQALGQKYDLVNRDNLRGAGIFSLDYGGGAPELWNTLATHFTLTPSAAMNVTACPGDGFAVVSWSPAASSGGPITSYAVAPSPSGTTANAGGKASSVAVTGLTDGSPYTFSVTASNAYGPGQVSAPSSSVTPASASSEGWPGQLNPLNPGRVLDTRIGTGGFTTLAAGQTIDLAVLGHGGVPVSGVAAVLLNLTVTNPRGLGFITAFPGGGCPPSASNLNFTPGRTVANLAEEAVGANGTVSLFNGSSGTVDLVVDVEGWVATAPSTSGGAGRFQATAPVRLLDTRTHVGIATLAPHQTVTLPVAGHGGVPSSGAEAVAVNLTVTNPSSAGFLTAFPTGSAVPVASNLNFTAGQTVPNRAVLGLGQQGQISFYNGSTGSIDMIVDLNGWFTDATAGAAGGLYTGLTTVRLLDTRDGTGGFSAPVAAHGNVALPIAGVLSVPATGARAVVVNVTVTGPQTIGFITAYPGATATPGVSDLNYTSGLTVANFVVVAVGSDGKVDFYNGSTGSTDLIVDLVGWYS